MSYVRKYLLRRRIAVGMARGDPGLFGSIAKGLGKIAGPVLKSIPGVGTVASIAGLVAGPAAKLVGKMVAGRGAAATTTAMVPYAATGAQQLMRATGGRLGGLALGAGAGAAAGALLGRGGAAGRRYRRINPLNQKAARKAIARVKAVRKLCRTIESQLPKAKCSCGPRRRAK